ncbi:unnamed protein product [Hermetia illucens]|uniref:Dolichyl-diphosphooligosaccharide--protein glycosyltransferase subunit KCP2 n=1 Tax=Hermetia illucens TaxID=343691 RepID=A0A7R8V3H5_HERIL|nr:protein KRTCAP2 homolog [Hermetia illucens]CAD7092176.1 unnamed protein product [Hermetia illucens]
MAASSSISMILASVFSILIFSTMQLYRTWFAASQLNTILGGYLGSWLFIFSLTALNNLESIALGDGFQAKFFPEVLFSLIGAVFACSMVHRVCATTCFIFSIIGLYFVNKISQRVHNMPAATEVFSKKKRK